MPVFASTRPRAGLEREAVLERPVDPGDGQRPQERAELGPGQRDPSSSATTALAVRRSRLERPEPSANLTPASGTPVSVSAVSITRACRRRARPRLNRPELPHEQLGGVVVALAAHEAHDLGQRLGDVPRERQARGRQLAGPRPACDADARRLQRLPQQRSGRERGVVRGPAAVPAAVDGERDSGGDSPM